MLIAAAAAAAADKKTSDVKNTATSGPPSPLVRTGSSSLQNSSAPGSPVVQPYPDQKSSISKLEAGKNSILHQDVVMSMQ